MCAHVYHGRKGQVEAIQLNMAHPGVCVGRHVKVFEKGDQAAMAEAIAQLEDGNWAIRACAVNALCQVDAVWVPGRPREHGERGSWKRRRVGGAE